MTIRNQYESESVRTETATVENSKGKQKYRTIVINGEWMFPSIKVYNRSQWGNVTKRYAVIPFNDPPIHDDLTAMDTVLNPIGTTRRDTDGNEDNGIKVEAINTRLWSAGDDIPAVDIVNARVICIHRNPKCVRCGAGEDGMFWAVDGLANGNIVLNAYGITHDSTGEYKWPVLLTMDYILPRSMGGLTVQSNLQTMCASCNSRKHSRMSKDDLMSVSMVPLDSICSKDMIEQTSAALAVMEEFGK